MSSITLALTSAGEGAVLPRPMKLTVPAGKLRPEGPGVVDQALSSSLGQQSRYQAVSDDGCCLRPSSTARGPAVASPRFGRERLRWRAAGPRPHEVLARVQRRRRCRPWTAPPTLPRERLVLSSLWRLGGGVSARLSSTRLSVRPTCLRLWPTIATADFASGGLRRCAGAWAVPMLY